MTASYAGSIWSSATSRTKFFGESSHVFSLLFFWGGRCLFLAALHSTFPTPARPTDRPPDRLPVPALRCFGAPARVPPDPLAVASAVLTTISPITQTRSTSPLRPCAPCAVHRVPPFYYYFTLIYFILFYFILFYFQKNLLN